MDEIRRLLGIRPFSPVSEEQEEKLKELTDPDAEYVDSLARDLRVLSDDVKHYAWCIQEGEEYHSEMQGKSLVNRLQKISTLFKKRFDW